MKEIKNRVAESKLVTIDLEDYYPDGNRIQFDIKDWLFEGLVLREKDFRASVKAHDWSQYDQSYVCLFCSSDAIIPDWAYMLITINLMGIAKKVILGDLAHLESILYTSIISDIDLSEYKDMPVIIKGCSHKPVPTNALIMLTERLVPVAKSIMFGEACSAVPLHKKN